MKRILATLILAALALTACSSAPKESSSATFSRAPDAAGAVTNNPASKATPSVRPTASLHVVSTPAPDCFAMMLRYADQNPIDNYVSVTVDVSRGFGPNCAALAPGRDCFIPLAGSWRAIGGPGGALRIHLFEDDAKTPARNILFKPIGAAGQLSRVAGFRYEPSKGTKIAKFTVALLDSSGKEVAETEDQILPIPTCDPRRRA